MKLIGERISYVDKDDKTTFVIVPATPGYVKSLMGAWFAMWIVIGSVIMWSWFSGYAFEFVEAKTAEEKSSSVQQLQLILVVFMVFWTYYFVRVGRAFSWIMWGKEMLKVDKIALTIKNSTRNYGKAKEFFLENIEKVRVAAPKEGSLQSVWENSPWVKGGERLEFDYMGKTIRFGRKLSEKEAKLFFQVLTKRIEEQIRKSKKSANNYQ